MHHLRKAYQLFQKRPYSIDIMCALGLILVSLYVHSFLIGKDANQFVNDASRYNGFQAMLTKYAIQHFGQFAFWDNLLSGGRSWISDPAGPHFSPFTYPIIAVTNDVYTATRFIILTHAIIAPLCFYFFLRVIGLHHLSSFLFSIPFIANRYAVTFGINGWLEEYYGFYLIPLSAALYWLAVKKQNFWYAVLCGLVLALHFFENTFYVFHYNLIVILWLAVMFGISILITIFRKPKATKKKMYKNIPRVSSGIWRILFQSENRTTLITFVLINIVMLGTMVGIAAIKILPLLEFRELSSRKAVPLEVVEAPGEVETFQFLYRRFFSIITEPANASTAGTSMLYQFTNFALLGFVVIAIIYFLFKRKFLFATFAGLLFIAVWAYLANRIPIDLYAFFYHVIPGFNSNRLPFRFFIIIHFAFFVLAALGFNYMLQQTKFYLLRYIVIISAVIIFITSFMYTHTSYKALRSSLIPQPQILELLNKTPTFSIQVSKDYTMPPQIDGDTGENILYLLTHLIRSYSPEGRVFSTYQNYDSVLIAPTAFITRIPSLLHSYEAQLPTYQYHLLLPSSPADPLESIIKRYKMLSIYNIRFQQQGIENFEFHGCQKLDLPQQEVALSAVPTPSPRTQVCEYLENRLEPIMIQSGGGLYYDKDVLEKVTTLANALLVVSDNRMNDFSSFIARQLIFHPSFDVYNTTVFTGTGKELDAYSIDELKQFAAIALVDAKQKDTEKTQRLLQDYQSQGGKVVNLTSTWREFDNLQRRSDSIYTDNPAWQYAEEDEVVLQGLYMALTGPYDKPAIQVELFTPEKIKVRLTTQKSHVPFQFSDTYFPGWKARIDGEVAPIYMADSLVKGLIIKDPGEHIVEMFYSPDSLKKGASITVVTAAIIIAGGIYAFIRRKKIAKRKKEVGPRSYYRF